MPLIFPSNPTVNQTYQSGSTATYQWDGTKWTVVQPTSTTVVTARSASFASTSTSASFAITASFIPSFEWINAGTCSIGAITTAPTKGTIVYDNVRYRKINSTTHEVEFNYAQSVAGNAGSGNYLFSLPAGITWGPGVLQTTSDTVATYIPRTLITNGQVFNALGQQRLLAVIPYDSTRFRLIGNNLDGEFAQVSSTYYSLSGAGNSYKFSFYTTV